MPRSTKHKSHRQSKHSSRDYSDSEEDVKMKDKSSKDENLVKVNRDSVYGEKRKSSSQVREGREVKNMIEHENGGACENYFSSKRRKENFGFGGDRWNGGDDEIGKSDRVVENETIKGEGFKVESKSKEFSNKGDSLRNKSKKYESGSTGEKNESLSSVAVKEKEGKSKTESKRKSERDYSVRKEGKESKDKDRRHEKEKGPESNRGDEVKLADVDVGKRMGLQQVDLIVERQFKRGQENSDFPVQDESRNSEFEKEVEKRTRRRREGSSDRSKHHDAFKDGEERGFTSRNDQERGFTSRNDRAKDVKYKDDNHKDEIYADKYHENDYKDDRQRDEKCHKETSKDNKYRDDKHKIDGEKDVKRREDRHREDDDRENRTKDEKNREDGERDTKWTYDKYREGTERDSQNRDDRRHEDGDRDHRRRDDRYHEDCIKNGRHGDERYYEDGNKDRLGSNSHKEDANRDIRHKEEKHREDVERESRHNNSKQGSNFDRGTSLGEAKYRDERVTGDRSVDKSNLRHSIDDGYVPDYHFRKSSAYSYSPTHDEQTARNRDDQGMRRPNEKGNYNDIKSQSTDDQRFDAEKCGSGARIDSTRNREGRSTSRNADVEINSSHSRQRSSPSSSSLAPRDRHRLSKQDEPKYRDYGYEERQRHNLTSTRDYASTIGGSDKTSLSWSVEKQVQKEDGHLGDFAERRLTSDSRSSPTQLTEKSPPTSMDRRQFSRSDVRRSIDVEGSTQRSGGSRDVNEYSGKEGRGRHESAIDMFPGNELSQADTDALSVSSPFTRNNHLSGSSKSFPPPPNFRTGVESPLLGSAEDDSRFKSNSRHRRSGDPNMGRVYGNAWRGVPGWPSPVVNGFMPLSHAPVNFHSVMQPFQTPMFGIRPSVDMNHPAPYHIPNPDRFSGPGRPIGWRNPVDDPCPPLHAWDASNASLRDESHIYGRPGWNHSRNLPDGRGWDTTGDLWRGPNRTASLEISSSEKENNLAQNADEVSTSQSIRLICNEQTFPGQPAESSDVNQSNFGSGNNAVKAPQIPEDTSDATKTSKKDDVLLCHVYLSKLDISADLTEPDLLNQCSGYCDMDQIIVSDIHDSKILYVEEAGKARVESHQILRYFLSTPKDDSIFMRAMSLYKRQKDNFGKVVAEEKFSKPKSHREDPDAEDNTDEKQSSTGDSLSAEEAPALANTNVDVNPMNTLLKVEGCTEATHEKPILPVALAMGKSEEPVSTLEMSNMQVDLASNIVQQDHIVEENHLSVESNKGFDTSLPANMKNDGNIEELNLDGTECVTLLNSDLFSEVSEAMMPESLVSGSVNLSRIHHSPESTH